MRRWVWNLMMWLAWASFCHLAAECTVKRVLFVIWLASERLNLVLPVLWLVDVRVVRVCSGSWTRVLITWVSDVHSRTSALGCGF